MSDIFISYASQDRETARELAERLGERGHSVWWDRTIPPGRVFDEVIQEALNSAECVVVLWSAHSVRSNWVKVEAEEAMARNRLLPVMIEDVMPPIQFKRIQAANLTGWNSDADHPEFRNLLASIERLLAQSDDTVPAPRPLATRNDAPTAKRRPKVRRAVAIACVAALAIVAASLFLLFRVRDDRSAAASSPPSTQAQATPSLRQELPSSRSRNGSEPADSRNASTPPRRGDQINLVAPENGGELLTAADAHWAATVDGDENTSLSVPFYTGGKSEAVFGFKDGRSATFDSVEILIPGSSGNNVAEFELLTANDTPDGRFEPIQVFKTRNMLIVKERFQRFTFKPRTARFVKFRLLRAHAELTSPYLSEWRLLGTLN